jgi:hypothetical protein
MADSAVKQRFRRAKARAVRQLQGNGWTVFPLADRDYHLLARKGPFIRIIKIDIDKTAGIPVPRKSPIGDGLEIWFAEPGRESFKVLVIK